MKIQNNLSNDIEYALKQTQLNIQKELKDYLNNQTRLFYLYNYSHLRQYLPQRFLIKLEYNKSRQVNLPAMSNFEFQDKEIQTAMTLNDSSLYPINKVNSKLDAIGHLKLDFFTSQAFQFFYDYFDFSLELINDKNSEMLQWFYYQLIDIDCYLTLNFEDNTQVTKKTTLKANNANILPINIQILEKVHSPELAFNIRCPLKQIYSNTGCKYVKSINIDISVTNLIKIENFLNKSFCFTCNQVAIYNLQRDFSITQTIDAHHNNLSILPKNLSGFNLYQPLSLYINEEKHPVYNDDLQICYDDEKQTLSIISNNKQFNKPISIDGLWTKQFNDINFPIVCNDTNITASVLLLKKYNQTLRPSLEDLQKVVTNLASVRTNIQKNDLTKQLIMFLFTQQLDYKHSFFQKLEKCISFDNGNIKAKKNIDFYLAWKVKYTIDLFIKANKQKYT